MATLDGTWELHPMIVLQPVEPHRGQGFTITFEDVEALLELVDNEPGVADDGFMIVMGEREQIVEFPPGEPAHNAVAALRWFARAMRDAGPMPATS